MSLVPTGEMTLGPFFPREFAQGANDLAAGVKQGEVIEITGRITQLDGRPLDNLVLEIWQADSEGRFDNANFFGWGRAATDANGVYRFRTIKPGGLEGRAPHVNFLLLCSGLMRHLQTAMFFAAAEDPVLDAVPAELRPRLVAGREGTVYRFDIRLRGDGETPFFDD
ncbi:MAG TPA: protocatechuate 3,4-dioxygenase subunit alpha [Burkholderiales bacterium]|nr:protocatechuate 3,4-dioxygenase subunit alpha [Burkholderiales bacterium]